MLFVSRLMQLFKRKQRRSIQFQMNGVRHELSYKWALCEGASRQWGMKLKNFRADSKNKAFLQWCFLMFSSFGQTHSNHSLVIEYLPPPFLALYSPPLTPLPPSHAFMRTGITQVITKAQFKLLQPSNDNVKWMMTLCSMPSQMLYLMQTVDQTRIR